MLLVQSPDDVSAVPPATGTQLRQILGHIPTGVVVVAGLDEQGKPVGLTVGSFTSVSLEPPLVAFYVARTSGSWPAIRGRGAFCVSVLGHDQGPVSGVFARSGGDKFAGVPWEPATRTGMPRLLRSHVWVDCRLEREVDIGDHFLVVGEIVDLEAPGTSGPLVFYQGRYHQVLHSAPPAPDEVVYWIPVPAVGHSTPNVSSESGPQPDQLTSDVGGGMDLIVGAEAPVDEPQPGLGGHDHGLAGEW
jgi:flavin reductase (DIM6/NTAB) family NADH-FMN oxidoreductase RutF